MLLALSLLFLLFCKGYGITDFQARADVASCAETFDFYAGVGEYTIVRKDTVAREYCRDGYGSRKER